MKYIILCVAGQSNAVGYDESVISEDYLNNFEKDRLFQLGFYEEENLKIIPLKELVHNFQDMRPYSNPANYKSNLGNKGIHLPLANLLLNVIPSDYNLLIIPCAYGGTGFLADKNGIYDQNTLKPVNCTYWGIDSPFYKAMKDRIAYALDLNENNLFLGTVWIQGENDFEDPFIHYDLFKEMVQDFFDSFKAKYNSRVINGCWNKDIWYNIETVAYWYEKKGCVDIWENYKKWNPDTYVKIPEDTSSNLINGTKITSANLASHFGNNSFINTVAPLVYQKIKRRFK